MWCICVYKINKCNTPRSRFKSLSNIFFFYFFFTIETYSVVKLWTRKTCIYHILLTRIIIVMLFLSYIANIVTSWMKLCVLNSCLSIRWLKIIIFLFRLKNHRPWADQFLLCSDNVYYAKHSKYQLSRHLPYINKTVGWPKTPLTFFFCVFVIKTLSHENIVNKKNKNNLKIISLFKRQFSYCFFCCVVYFECGWKFTLLPNTILYIRNNHDIHVFHL